MTKEAKKKGKQKKSSYYKISGDKIESKKLSCPKCGAGVFMAEHKDRMHCGKCSFTQMK
ncbi:MAG: 30S ribosomal protein S27ae [archaeon]|nr:30S ribosomal protein S27ae [archaeon]